MEAPPKESVEPDRTLAQIVKVISLTPIDGADKIELAKVLGWDVIVKKNEFIVGDLGIYFNIGSILDKTNPATSFLDGKVLKTKKMRGVLSQGLLGPLDWLSYYKVDPKSVKEDDDVTKVMKVEKYVSIDELSLYKQENDDITTFPILIPKTDEPRAQQTVKKLRELENKNVIITQKYDGTSATYMTLNDKFALCNRNNMLLREENYTSCYFEIARRYKLEENMLKLKKNIAIQGEIIGPKINGNRHKVKDMEYYVFNIWDADKHYYLSFEEIKEITTLLGLKTVPVVYQGIMKKEWLSIDALLILSSEQLYDTGTIAEGIVVKSNYGFGHPRTSFKVISNKYLLKYDL